jgi:acyl-coenzyme A synthetase/AMP-(fatty) acid ligase
MASLPPEVARHAHCLTADERAAVAETLRTLNDETTTTANANNAPFLAAWRALTQRALHPGQPFALHRALHAAVYRNWDVTLRGPRPVWVPGPQEALETNAAAFMASWHGDAWWERARTGHPQRDWPLLQRVSVQSPELFWSAVLRDAIGVRFDVPPYRILDETGLRGDGGDGGCCGGGGDGGGACCGEEGSSSSGSCCSKKQQQQGSSSSGPLGPDSVRWLPGARLNIAAAALLSPKSPDGGGGGGGAGVGGAAGASSTSSHLWSAPCCDGEPYETTGASPALLWAEDGHPHAVRRVSWPALRARAARVARALAKLNTSPGDAVAIDMPMSCDAVAIYLGIVLSGAVVVSIADSFAPSEIAARLRISGAKLVFTQDVVSRGGPRPLPLYERVLEARAPRCVVLPASRVGKAWGSDDGTGDGSAAPLREGDLSWGAFLAAAAANDGAPSSSSSFAPRSLPAEAPSNILFSSGTTGEPKAVVWSHATPLRAAVDAWAHQDVRPGDSVCWPTNLGWMMGPWLVYGALLNGAAAAVYHGAPGGADFCAFVAAARVTQLGLVPSIVRSWRAAKGGGLLGPPDDEQDGAAGKNDDPPKAPYLPDWSALRCFSSTGEASSPDDYHWLASRVRGYRPVVEYCGGTEIGGGFLSGCLLQPQAAAAFSTPTLGAALVLLGGSEGEMGEQSPHGGGAPPFVG